MIRSNLAKYLHLSLSLLGICFLTNHSKTQSIADLQLTIPQGSLQGRIWTTHHKRNVLAFERIPYGQPPIGDLRRNLVLLMSMRYPISTQPHPDITSTQIVTVQIYTGRMPNDNVLAFFESEIDNDEIRKSSTRGPMERNPQCYQCWKSVYPDIFGSPCRRGRLLIYTRLHASIMVFVHGGAFQKGGPVVDSRNPHFLLDKDVLLVVPNYRLGPLGFLSTGDEVAPGNWGLKDVILALKWIQSNIEYFGGDPNRMTLFGSSSGSIMVHLLTLSDATDGLYHQYITTSGSALTATAHRPRAAYAGRAFELGGYVGCVNHSSYSLIDCLRTTNASDIIATYTQFLVWRSEPSTIWGPTDEPVIEGAVLTDSPANLLAAGKMHDLPCIIGVTRDEGLGTTAEFYEKEEVLYDFLENFDYLLPIMLSWTFQSDSGAAWVEAVKSYYLNNDLTQNASVLIPHLTLLFGDATFIYPAYSGLQKQLASTKNPQYFYSFNYEGTISSTYVYAGTRKIYGVPHGDEMNYLFLRTEYYAGHGGNMSETDLKMVDIMVELWTSFAINGTPTSSALNASTPWRSYSSQDSYLRIGNYSDITPGIEYSFLPERMQFWANLETTATTVDSVSASSSLNYVSVLLLALLLLGSKLS